LAERFAGSTGKVYETLVPDAVSAGVEHISHVELLKLLKGTGHGQAKWRSAFEVMQARRYVEQSVEHLLGFARFKALTPQQIEQLLQRIYR
jgi:hypothetical protein